MYIPISIIQKILTFLPTPQENILQKLSRRESAQKSKFHVEMKREQSVLQYSIEEGRKKLAQQKYDLAYEIFSTLVKENPNSRWALHGLGDANQYMSCYEQARVNYQKAYDLSQKQPQTESIIKEKGLHLAGMANALMGLGHIEKANYLWEQVVDCDPTLLWMRENALHKN